MLELAPSSKRSKSGGSSSDPLVLGPAHAGGNARRVRDSSAAAPLEDGVASDDAGEDGRPAAKRAKKAAADPEEEETVASRLAQLRAQLIADEEEEDEKDTAAASAEEGAAGPEGSTAAIFQPKNATTESLSQLLQQALHDESLLELCLAVTNPAILRESVTRLSNADVSRLVAFITSRLAHRPGRADALCAWLQALLQTRKASLEVLQPLHNLIGERVEVLPALLKLEGRLSLLSP
jgi:U3 small nucleolar RNA-associated protein 5